jgi:DNA helicase-2/ATP-dependent DNA helicase PcrA
MEAAKGIPDNTSLAAFISEILDASGYKKSLDDEDSLESRARLENIDEFLNSIYDYEAMNMRVTLDEFLQEVSLLTSAEDPSIVDEAGMITLMTVHIAKGLEFPVVFLTGMEEGTFPHSMSSDTEEELEEERRLCYVGITRAMNRLFITSSKQRRVFSDIRDKTESRFILEIPEKLLEPEYYPSEDYFSGTRNQVNYSRASLNDSPIKSVVESVVENIDKGNSNGSRFIAREIVMHPKYGTGIVTSIKGTGDNIKLTISFNGRSKSFLEKYVNLEKR